MARSDITADTSVASATFQTNSAKYQYAKSNGPSTPGKPDGSADDISDQLARSLDYIEAAVNDIQSRLPNGDGGSLSVEYVKSGTGEIYLHFRTVAGADTAGDKRIGFDASEQFLIQHYTGSAWVNSFVIVDATDVRIPLVSPEVALGTGGGSPSLLLLKSDAGAAEVMFNVSSFTPVSGSKRIAHDASEQLVLQHYNGASWDSALVIPNGPAGTVQLGDFTGTATLRLAKDDTGAGVIQFYSEATPNDGSFRFHHESDEEFSLQRWDTSAWGDAFKFAGLHMQSSTTAGITASATQTQGQQPLTTDLNQVATVTTTNDVVTLPSAAAGRRCVIINNGANTLQIFPASGDDLGAGVDTSTTLAAGSVVRYEAYDATNWVAT